MYKDAVTCKNNGHDVPDIHSSTHTHTQKHVNYLLNLMLYRSHYPAVLYKYCILLHIFIF